MLKKIYHFYKYLKKKHSKDFTHFLVAYKCPKKWYGNNYGGFFVCPNEIKTDSVVYSFGIGEDISFDLAMIKNHNCTVFGFDPTPKSINWVKSHLPEKNFNFYEYGLSDKTGTEIFYLPKNTNFVSGSTVNQKNVDRENSVEVQMKSLSDTMAQLGHDHIDVLKIDIEGSEYQVIENIVSSKIKIKQLLVEFHDRFVEGGSENSKRAVKLLQEAGFEIFAVSRSFEEISFIRKD